MAPPGSLGTGLGLHISQMAKGHGVKKSLEFTQLIKAIGECKAKVEEDAIVAREVDTLKRRLADPEVDKSRLQEYLLRLIYVEMLGHSASFGYIHAVKLTCEHNLPNKRVGYLAVSLFLDDSHDLLILIVNTLQQDLKSNDPLTVAAALTTAAKVLSGDNATAVLPQVTSLLAHRSDSVRKKALMTLHRFYQRNPSGLAHLVPKFRSMLCDKDPSVMAAALNPLLDLAAEDPAAFRNLVPSFANIFKQVLERRLPKGMDHPKGAKSVPAPFVQVKLLRLLRLLARGDETASKQAVPVVAECLRSADNGTNIGHAIIAEAVKTVAVLPLTSGLLQPAADAVARFLRAKSNNLKYVGIDALCDVVAVSPNVAVQHQWAVIECLEDADETLRRKTLDLLFAMCGPHNVEVIAGRMLGYIRSGGGDEASIELTCSRVASLAERFAPSNEWFITTMNAVFELGGALVKADLAQDLIRLIAEGARVEGPGAAEADAALRGSACTAYWDLLHRPKVPAQLLCIALWVLGEYGATSGVAQSTEELQDRIAAAVESFAGTHSDGVTAVQRYALTALAKIVAQHGGPLSRNAAALATQASRSRVTDLAQRAAELSALVSAPRSLAAVAVPFDSSAKEVPVLDPDLHFLDGYVAQALARGASPYQPPEVRTTLANPVSPAEAAASAAMATRRRDMPAGNSGAALAGAQTPVSPARGDDMDIFGLGVMSGASSSSAAAAAAAMAMSAAPSTPQAAPREEEREVTLNVSGPRKWGPHVTRAANPAPAAASPGAVIGSGNDLDAFDAFTGGLGSGSQTPVPQQPQQRVAAPATPQASSTPHVVPAAREPQIDPAKAKLAAALFSGGSGGGGGPSLLGGAAGPSNGAATVSSPAPAFAARNARQQQPAQQQKPAASQSVDLLGQLSSPTPPAPKPFVAASQDLLNELAGPAPPPMLGSMVPPFMPSPVGMQQFRAPVPAVATAQPSTPDPFASLAPVVSMPGASAAAQQPMMQRSQPAAMMPPQSPLVGAYQSPVPGVRHGTALDTRVLDQLLAGAPPPTTPLPAVFGAQTPQAAAAKPRTPDPFSNLLS